MAKKQIYQLWLVLVIMISVTTAMDYNLDKISNNTAVDNEIEHTRAQLTKRHKRQLDCTLTCLNFGTINEDCSACVCISGVTGQFCEQDIDECAERPCRNGGRCTNTLGSFFCGAVDNCDPNPCENEGTCINGVDSFTCNCLSSFFGDHCENENHGAGGNDPHFFLPLLNGDNLCFSVQGQPDFMFSLIKDKYVQLNAKFVLPVSDESNIIANVSTLIGDLGLTLYSPVSGSVTIIKVSAHDHSVSVDDSKTEIEDMPVTVKILSDFTVAVSIGKDKHDHMLRDETAWLSITSELGFGLKIKFYKKHMDMILTEVNALTKHAHGMIGQFLKVNAVIDYDYNLLKFDNRLHPIQVKKAPGWHYLSVTDGCWYGVSTDNQGSGVIEGNYMDYIVQQLV